MKSRATHLLGARTFRPPECEARTILPIDNWKMSVLRGLCGRGRPRSQAFALCLPLRRQQSSTPIFGQSYTHFIQFLPIPEFARHLSMRLIQSFAIIRVGTAAYFITPTELHFDEPIGIGQSLTRKAGNVCLA